MLISQWAHKYRISADAVVELRRLLIAECDIISGSAETGESGIQTEIRLEASKRGWRLWRNNRGAGMMENGNFVRFGLANDSAAMNQKIKSHDLIGIRPITITPFHSGMVIGQFVSLEVKCAGWKYSENDKHTQAQKKWSDVVTSLGGYAAFTTGEF